MLKISSWCASAMVGIAIPAQNVLAVSTELTVLQYQHLSNLAGYASMILRRGSQQQPVLTQYSSFHMLPPACHAWRPDV